ncbi:CRISPR-associated endonuclease Cas1 [Aciditerrimonas ferrireducens]|nr:CRISPR-associated endonuclease Cas1 [Aciditerrimonas ferrireducens]MCK4176170.1 CRISPR-associated endonuclease Cas1 [Aciditerrimonas ferrireducens]
MRDPGDTRGPERLEPIPVEQLRTYEYCPRRFYLEWVNPEGPASEEVSAVDPADAASEPTGPERSSENGVEELRTTTVSVRSERLGLRGAVDVVEDADGRVIPVEIRPGAGRDEGRSAWESDVVLLCVKALLLREMGYACERGVLHYLASNTRVLVAFTEERMAAALATVEAACDLAESPNAPQPLVDSPKCPRCPVVSVCLPDEVNLLLGRTDRPPRRLVPTDEDAKPLYVGEQGSTVRAHEGRLVVTSREGELASFLELDISQLCVYGAVQVTTPAIQRLLARGVPVCWFSSGGWFYGMATGLPSNNVQLRIAQYRLASSREALKVCREIVAGKLRNARTLLRRNARGDVSQALARIDAARTAAETASSIDQLLGIEGSGARAYFSAFRQMISVDSTGTRRGQRPALLRLQCPRQRGNRCMPHRWTRSFAGLLPPTSVREASTCPRPGGGVSSAHWGLGRHPGDQQRRGSEERLREAGRGGVPGSPREEESPLGL